MVKLSDREREVDALLAKGLTNPQIAERLGITVGTVKVHVSHILDKRGYVSRYEIKEPSK